MTPVMTTEENMYPVNSDRSQMAPEMMVAQVVAKVP
jgi:hypothetical protein